MQLTQNTAIRIPIRLVGNDGTGITGMVASNFSSSQVLVVKSSGVTSFLSLSGNLFEINSTYAPGLYHIALGSGNTDTLGPMQIGAVCAASEFVPVVLSMDVASTANTLSTLATQSSVATLQTTANTILTDVSTVETNVGTILTDVGTLLTDMGTVLSDLTTIGIDVSAIDSAATSIQKFQQGKQHIFTSGLDANRWVVYDSDNTTVFKKYDLQDASGSPTTTNTFIRIPV